MLKKVALVISLLLCFEFAAFSSDIGIAESGIVGSWSGTISAAGITASASVSFSDNGSYYISAYNHSSSGSYSYSGGSITFSPSSPSGFDTTTMSISLNRNSCKITGSVKGISGTLTLTRKTFKLNKSSASINEGKTLTLSAVRPNSSAVYKNLVWSSSSPDIASVTNKGKVTAYKAGITLITATAGNGDTANCLVTVRSTVATSISLNRSSVSLKSGKYITLTAKVLPSYATNKTVTWRSSNTAVATVSSKGKVIAHTTGTATITASTVNGISATCTVSVMGVQVTSVGISKRSATMYTNSTLQLTATVSPSSAVDKSLRWSSSNPAIASVTQNGLVTANSSAGKATITATSSNGKKNSCTITVKKRK